MGTIKGYGGGQGLCKIGVKVKIKIDGIVKVKLKIDNIGIQVKKSQISDGDNKGLWGSRGAL